MDVSAGDCPRHGKSTHHPSLSRRRVSGQAAISEVKDSPLPTWQQVSELSHDQAATNRFSRLDPSVLNRKHRPFATPANFLTKTDRTHQTRPRELQHPIWPYCCRQDARTSDISSSVRERTRLDEKKRSNPADKCLISPFPSTSTSAASKRGRNTPWKNGP